MSSYLQRHLRTHSINSGRDSDSSAQSLAPQNGQAVPASQRVQLVPDIPTTLNVEVCNQPSTLNSQTFFLVQVPQQNTPTFILVPSSQLLQPQQKVPVAPSTSNLVTIQSNASQRAPQNKVLRKKPKAKASNAVTNFTSPNKNILIMPNTTQTVPNLQPLQIQTIQGFPRAQTLPIGQNIIVLQNVTDRNHLQLPTMHMNAIPSAPKTANIQIQQLPSTQDITIQSLPGAQEVSNIQIKAGELPGIQTVSSSQNIANMHIHQELSNVHLQTSPNKTHLSDIHIQTLPEPQSVSSLQESQNLIVVQNSPGEELLSSESVENLQSMEEVQDVHFETLQTEEGLQNVLVLQNADGEQTRLCVQGVENIQGIQDVSNVQIQAMSNIQEPGATAPECQKLFIIQSSQGEQTLQMVDNFQNDPNLHMVENLQGLQAGQNQLQLLPSIQSHNTVQLPQNMQLRTVPANQGLQTVQKFQGLQNIQTVGAGNQNVQTIQLVQKNSGQGLQHVLPLIQIVQAAPKVQLVHTF